jgi:hypothetical protein
MRIGFAGSEAERNKVAENKIQKEKKMFFILSKSKIYIIQI